MLLMAALDARRSEFTDPDVLGDFGATFAVNLRGHASNYSYSPRASTPSMVFFWIVVSRCGY